MKHRLIGFLLERGHGHGHGYGLRHGGGYGFGYTSYLDCSKLYGYENEHGRGYSYAYNREINYPPTGSTLKARGRRQGKITWKTKSG